MSAAENLYTAINGINQLIIDKTAALQPPPLYHHPPPCHPEISPIYTEIFIDNIIVITFTLCFNFILYIF